MDDLMSKLSDVLNDPQSMQQISQLASMFGAGADNSSVAGNVAGDMGNAGNSGNVGNAGNAGNISGSGNTNTDNSGGMGDLSSMLSSLMAGMGGQSGQQGQTGQTVQQANAAAQPSPPAPPAGDMPDLARIMQIGSVISSSGANDKNIALLYALKPLLKEENQKKVDRLVKIFRLMAAYPLIKESGLLGGDLFG